MAESSIGPIVRSPYVHAPLDVDASRSSHEGDTNDRNAPTFYGVLHDVAAATSYRIRVERAGADGP